MTSAAVYNLLNHNVIHWTPNGLSYPFWITLPNNDKQYGVPINDTAYVHMEREQSSWKLVVHGPSLCYGSTGVLRERDLKLCIEETARMLLSIVALSKSQKIVELELRGTDGISPRQMMDTDFRPFTHLKRVHFLNCRQVTMRSAGMYLFNLGEKATKYEVIFTTGRPEIDALNNSDWRGAVLSDLYYWRAQQPNRFMDNLLHNTGSRDYIQYYTGSSGDD